MTISYAKLTRCLWETAWGIIPENPEGYLDNLSILFIYLQMGKNAPLSPFYPAEGSARIMARKRTTLR